MKVWVFKFWSTVSRLILLSPEGLCCVLPTNGGLEIAFANTPFRKLFVIGPIFLIGIANTLKQRYKLLTETFPSATCLRTPVFSPFRPIYSNSLLELNIQTVVKFQSYVTVYETLCCILRDVSPRNTPHRRSEWWSSLPPDCFVSRASIPHVSVS